MSDGCVRLASLEVEITWLAGFVDEQYDLWYCRRPTEAFHSTRRGRLDPMGVGELRPRRKWQTLLLLHGFHRHARRDSNPQPSDP